MNTTLSKLLFLLLAFACTLPANALVSGIVANKVTSSGSNNAMAATLNKTYALLKKWSDHNLDNEAQLRSFAKKEHARVEDNTTFEHKYAWNKVKELNRNSLMLLEASYAFAKQTQTASDYQASAIRSKAFEECLKEEDCNFKKLNALMDKEALELSFFTSENALKTQQTLLDNIDKLEEFSNNSKESKGLNSSIDALSKINSAQASALVTLTSQISNLNKLTADTYQNEINEEQLAQKSDELFFASNNEVKSPHLDLEVKLTQ